MVQILIQVLVVFSILVHICTCTLMYRWIGGVLGGKAEQYVQLHPAS